MKAKRAKAAQRGGGKSRVSDVEDSQTEKQRLEAEISELRLLAKQIEACSDIARFGDVRKENFPPTESSRSAAKKLVDTNVLFRKEIHKFTGFFCAKANKAEYVFAYKPQDRFASGETFSVQIRNEDGKTALGKWVMPIAVDFTHILADTPIDNLSTVIPFLNNWKLHIDCYVQRKSQFNELKEFISEASNCTLEGNLSFTWITLQLFGVYDKSNDSCLDVVVYLRYKLNETRPCTISPDCNLKKVPPRKENELRTYTKCFKSHSLMEGFAVMLEKTHPTFSWNVKEHDDSPLELNNSSDSDEDSILERVKFDREKSSRKRRKHRESRARTKRMKGRSKAAKPQNEEQKSSEIPKLRLQNEETNRSQSESEKPIDEPLGKRKLRQTTISFRENRAKIENSTVVEMHQAPKPKSKESPKVETPKEPRKIAKKSAARKKPAFQRKKNAKGINRAITSTPIAKEIPNRVKFQSITEVQISPIVSGDEEGDK